MPAWFVFTDSSNETFVVRVHDADVVAHGRAVLAGEAEHSFRIGGKVVEAPAEYNMGWSFHIKPNKVEFYDISAEAGDLTMRQVEQGLDEVGETFLPNNQWASWSSELLFELRPIWGSDAHDRIAGGELHDLIMGGGGRDHLAGGAGQDYMNGGAGRDLLHGGAGADKLSGGYGADELWGGGGADTLIGAQGADRLTGRNGADTFLFNDAESRTGKYDLITDLSAEDTIHLSGVDGDVRTEADDALVRVEAFTGAAGELVVRYDAGRTFFVADLNGDAVADFVLAAEGDHRDFTNIVL